jgi:hypothetical protein
MAFVALKTLILLEPLPRWHFQLVLHLTFHGLFNALLQTLLKRGKVFGLGGRSRRKLCRLF